MDKKEDTSNVMKLRKIRDDLNDKLLSMSFEDRQSYIKKSSSDYLKYLFDDTNLDTVVDQSDNTVKAE